MLFIISLNSLCFSLYKYQEQIIIINGSKQVCNETPTRSWLFSSIMFLNGFWSFFSTLFSLYLLSETHIAKISKLGCYSNHRKLVELQDICEDCSSSSRLWLLWIIKDRFHSMIQGDDEKIVEKGEVNLRCFYCDVNLNGKFHYLYFLIKPS